MSKKTQSEPIRGCLKCGYKTHRRFWKSPRCPVCNYAQGFRHSTHGGLSEKEIMEAREEIESLLEGSALLQ